MFSLTKSSNSLKAKIKMLTGIFTVIFALVGFLGIFICTGMDTVSVAPTHAHSHAQMQSNCDADSLMNQCGMSIMDHISQWQSRFLATTDAGQLEIILLAVTALVFACATLLFQKEQPTKPKEILFYIRSHPEFSLYQTITSLFSQGILHPKILA